LLAAAAATHLFTHLVGLEIARGFSIKKITKKL
jgi:hypothetical protein